MRVAKALILDPDGRVLVLYRSGTHPSHPHEADLPGGIIEDGETYGEGLAREIREETGIVVQEGQLKLAATRRLRGYSHKQLFTVQLTTVPQVIISWEHERAEWIPADAFRHGLFAGDSFVRFAQDYMRRTFEKV